MALDFAHAFDQDPRPGRNILPVPWPESHFRVQEGAPTSPQVTPSLLRTAPAALRDVCTFSDDTAGWLGDPLWGFWEYWLEIPQPGGWLNTFDNRLGLSTCSLAFCLPQRTATPWFISSTERSSPSLTPDQLPVLTSFFPWMPPSFQSYELKTSCVSLFLPLHHQLSPPYHLQPQGWQWPPTWSPPP